MAHPALFVAARAPRAAGSKGRDGRRAPGVCCGALEMSLVVVREFR